MMPGDARPRVVEFEVGEIEVMRAALHLIREIGWYTMDDEHIIRSRLDDLAAVIEEHGGCATVERLLPKVRAILPDAWTVADELKCHPSHAQTLRALEGRR